MTADSPSALALLGARVNALRVQRVLTKVKLAKLLGLSTAHVTDFLNGKGSVALERLDDLSRVFGVEVADLFNPNASARPGAADASTLEFDHVGSSTPGSHVDTLEACLALLAEYKRALEKLVRIIGRETTDSSTRRARPDTSSAASRRRKSRARSA